MAAYEQFYQLAAIKVSGPFFGGTFISLGPGPTGEFGNFRRLLIGDGIEDPYKHAQLFDEICGYLNLMLSIMMK